MPDEGGLQPPTIKRRKAEGSDPGAFARRGTRGWMIASLVALVATAVLPQIVPGSESYLYRTTPAISLFFLLAAIGMWFRMGMRAFAVAAVLVLLMYGGTAWFPIAYDVADFTVIALLSSFAVFALAGFNLVFILEEIAFDAHRVMHLKSRWWAFSGTIVVVVLAIALPVFGIDARALWVASLAWTFIYIGWWTFRAFMPLRSGPVLKELHLLTAGTLAATGIVDAFRLARVTSSILPSLVMYAILVGTWIYVSYTTLQRAHFLLRADNTAPWLAILLSASFALLHHASFHYGIEGVRGVTILLEQRLSYLVGGIWIGMGFYIVHSGWRVLRAIRDDKGMSARGRIMAGNLARVAEDILQTERRLERAAASFFDGVDRLLPGHHKPPVLPASWEVDMDGVTRVEMDSEE